MSAASAFFLLSRKSFLVQCIINRNRTKVAADYFKSFQLKLLSLEVEILSLS